MKLTPVNKKLENSIWNSIYWDVANKTCNSASNEVFRKIIVEIRNPNNESISGMQIRTLNNLQDEINTNK